MEYKGNIYAKIGGKYIAIGHSDDYDTKKYTEEDIKKAIELARETESVRRGALSEDWDDIEKYDEMDIIYLLNKQD
jgi:hypothetical protein